MSVIPQARVYAPGADVTCTATAAITARRFVGVSGNRSARGNIAVATATAAARAFGVARNDAATGELVGIVRVTAGGTIAAGADVEVGADGKAVTKASGIPVGYAVTGATNNAVVELALF
ncbi:MAG TPA: DUF2190 family protein [Gordonia sp. (in: high G+C Gram-positive bacteria)]|uniref:capsid cement protein n=1 Tax=unclassified Gordonia (in: high G+C Gram-positive bacteria) TaxID=2657482 RepID=UPI000FC1906C|nr:MULTISPECIES: capsid cement protein [unclassified Gordonia (in: high G+C Gram-positive bacteria)]RUP35632.1 MAG: DUF2190 domain-containing protein [Gordonia sp. (in: high G+C Gram-positive bacteria)]HNP57509.1 DUF2190 family protein [Gordonia sp. (in: high G+C Gram-positive bacteria)]HRC51106.1 DUF2190 family protein [Gordonia sp. (in: high G+C Gram-positive bacteria)]